VFRPDADGSAVHLQPGPVDLDFGCGVRDHRRTGERLFRAYNEVQFLVTPAQGL
jgi:hypothetical protein